MFISLFVVFQVLLRPENFCGMQESQFRTMCADIGELCILSGV